MWRCFDLQVSGTRRGLPLSLSPGKLTVCPCDSSGSTGLIPPSHFQAQPLPAMPRMAPTWVSDIPLAHRGVSERRPDFQRPPGIVWEQDVCGDGQEPGWRGR